MKVKVDTIISRKRHICNVSLYIGDFVIHEIKVMYGRKGIYLIFPNMTYPINDETRQKILNLIIKRVLFIKYSQASLPIYTAKLEVPPSL